MSLEILRVAGVKHTAKLHFAAIIHFTKVLALDEDDVAGYAVLHHILEGAVPLGARRACPCIVPSRW
jgi:hypothetical protein